MTHTGKTSPVLQRAGRIFSRANGMLWAFSLSAALLVLFVVLPLLATLLGSHTAAVWETLRDSSVLASLWRTFYAGALATVIAMVGGIPLAYILARYRFPGRRWLQGLIDLPVVIPHTAAGIALLMVFGRRGVLGRWLVPLGMEFTDNMAGIVVAMLFVSLPFLVNASTEAFAMVNPELELMAQTEGANRWQAFRLVTLPLASRGILAGAVMMWARGISEFGAVVILAFHPQIVPVLLYERFQGYGLEAALPVAAILIVTSLGVFAIVRALLASRLDGDFF